MLPVLHLFSFQQLSSLSHQISQARAQNRFERWLTRRSNDDRATVQEQPGVCRTGCVRFGPRRLYGYCPIAKRENRTPNGTLSVHAAMLAQRRCTAIETDGCKAGLRQLRSVNGANLAWFRASRSPVVHCVELILIAVQAAVRQVPVHTATASPARTRSHVAAQRPCPKAPRS